MNTRTISWTALGLVLGTCAPARAFAAGEPLQSWVYSISKSFVK